MAFQPFSYASERSAVMGDFATTCRQKKLIRSVSLGPVSIPQVT